MCLEPRTLRASPYQVHVELSSSPPPPSLHVDLGRTFPVCAPQQAEAYEAFGKYLSVRPDLAVPLVRACLEHMALLPLDEPGSSPPPTHASPAWKKGFEARLCMATAVVTLAKVGLLARVGKVC